MKSKIVEVKESNIHNRGLFALQDIDEGRLIIEYIGERISKKKADLREVENDKIGVTYIFCLNDDCYIDGKYGGNESIYVNHSCEPNCKVVRKNAKIYFYSKRFINKGEELTIDYSYDKDSKKELCRCGSRKCRGVINEV
ncbi:MAG TPA: SET domain-containing protein-lysine N-methyltransferase [Spirochaetota bacterium]|jgi:SET domain-containing protein|nr:MAG: SET domain protein [Spirochaetes bacterium ADurb.Bin133]HNZ26312.1 SET domain-containing protein-lysine N-methyltransferase [Spirochaetota bacterium]HOF00079.1 SET domain-containing protein-lysine N-methyltransferase [Spirochaetota bacterium]HOS32001.1 SET domain-containing protein-lysine N-methyltransferase [Spirochaetota bacterium]HOS55229.1 SET domain-containing protein-lysine N-methyltransferase [Spirochaetota bacterium]